MKLPRRWVWLSASTSLVLLIMMFGYNFMVYKFKTLDMFNTHNGYCEYVKGIEAIDDVDRMRSILIKSARIERELVDILRKYHEIMFRASVCLFFTACLNVGFWSVCMRDYERELKEKENEKGHPLERGK